MGRTGIAYISIYAGANLDLQYRDGITAFMLHIVLSENRIYL